MLEKVYRKIILAGFLCSGLLYTYPAIAEPPIWEIYNTVFGDTYVTSNLDLENNYGVAYDEAFLETDGIVRASARYAGYTQSFGYYTDVCVGNSWVEIFYVDTAGYLSGCSAGSQNPGDPCADDSDCPDGSCIFEYDEEFLVGGGSSVFGYYDDPSGSPQWFSQPLLNGSGNYDHMKTFRSPDFDPLNPVYMLCWEDLNLGDADYNDLVVLIENTEPSIVQCCEDDGDCPDDGVFCNGDEICENSVCTHSGDPCDPYVCDEDDTAWTDGSCIVDPPITYQFDFDADEVWDTEWCLEIGETVDLDVWIDDYSLTTNSTGFYFDFQITPNLQVNLGSSYIYDSDHGGPWDPFWSVFQDEGGGTRWELTGGQFSGVPVVDGKVKIAVIQLERIAVGDTQIETQDGVVIDMDARPFVPVDANATIYYCDDGDWCNGVETCVDGVCVPGDNPCPDDGIFCNGDEGCDEDLDVCTHSGDPCLPDLWCDEDANDCGEPCEIEIYEGGAPVPPCNTYSKPGRRGLMYTCGDTVQFDYCTDCDAENTAQNDPCPEWSMTIISGTPPAGTFIDPATGLLTIGPDCTGLIAPVELEITITDPCNFDISDSVSVFIGEVILAVEGSSVSPADERVEVTVTMSNPNHKVKGMEVDLADEDNCLTCTGCTPDSDRALDYICSANEQADGSCKVVLATFDPAGMIEEGGGAIFTVDYAMSDCPDCAAVYAGSIVNVADRFGDPLCVCFEEGEICEYACGDVYPRECLPDFPECGDGESNIFDILEVIDAILGLTDLSACQEAQADVPTGTPPYCGCIGDEVCQTDGVNDIFDLLVIIDMALGKANCCDYCIDGQIY